MIYYSNVSLDIPHMVFIGRWSPFHKGHAAIMEKKLSQHPDKPILILVRNTATDIYSPVSRAQYLKIWMQKNHINGTIMIIPNVEGVYWGRDVGYHVGFVDVEAQIKQISGTRIRQHIKKHVDNWENIVAQPSAAHLLSGKTADIVERGMVVWLTGCPSSGKTTIATAFIKQVRKIYPHLKTQLLDGDIMRSSPIAANAGYSKQERANHIRKMAYLAAMFADHGILVVCAFVSPDKKIRMEAKNVIGDKRFLEIYVKASLKTRMKRDIKGLYKKAIQNQIVNFTGYNAIYEVPQHPGVVCDTDNQSIAECVSQTLSKLFN